MRIFLLDDEALALQYLGRLIDWAGHGYAVVGTATDSARAYNSCIEQSVDLLITDIRMPGMDGIELSRRLKCTRPQMMIILLTGYEDFDYAWRAIEIHADAYLLKDAIDEVSLLDALSKCRQNFEILKKNEQLAQERQLRDILFDAGGFNRYRPAGAFLRMGMLIRDDGFPLFPAYATVAPVFFDLAVLKRLFCEPVPMCMPYGRGAFLAMWASLSDVAGFNAARDALDRLARDERIHYRLLLAPPIRDGEQLTDWYRRCLWADENLIFFGTSESVMDLSLIQPWDLAQEAPLRVDYKSIQSALAEQNVQAVAEALNALFQPFEHIVHMGALRSTVNELVYCLEQAQRDASIPIVRDDLFIRNVRFHGLAEIKQFFAARFQAAIEQAHAHRSLSSPVLDKAVSWMRAHYAENISLTDVAEAMLISSVYLSQLFRKQAQTTFSDELTHIRIQSAKYMLRNTTMKIFEIARQAGFQKSQYFSQVFKSKTGMTPNEYRAAKAVDAE